MFLCIAVGLHVHLSTVLWHNGHLALLSNYWSSSASFAMSFAQCQQYTGSVEPVLGAWVGPVYIAVLGLLKVKHCLKLPVPGWNSHRIQRTAVVIATAVRHV